MRRTTRAATRAAQAKYTLGGVLPVDAKVLRRSRIASTIPPASMRLIVVKFTNCRAVVCRLHCVVIWPCHEGRSAPRHRGGPDALAMCQEATQMQDWQIKA